MANDSKTLDALAYISLGLRLATEALEEESRVKGLSTDAINARAEELHNQAKRMLDEDSASDLAEIQKSNTNT